MHGLDAVDSGLGPGRGSGRGHHSLPVSLECQPECFRLGVSRGLGQALRGSPGPAPAAARLCQGDRDGASGALSAAPGARSAAIAA